MDFYWINVLVAVEIEWWSDSRHKKWGEKKPESRNAQEQSTELGLRCGEESGLRVILTHFYFILTHWAHVTYFTV